MMRGFTHGGFLIGWSFFSKTGDDGVPFLGRQFGFPDLLVALMPTLRTILLWLLAAWLASGPSALLLHHNFAHGGATSVCCAAPTAPISPPRQDACCGHHASSCPVDRLAAETPADGVADEQRPSDGPTCPAESCPLCELLLHSHAIAIEAPALVVARPRASQVCEREAMLPHQWPHHVRNPRGPPNC